MLIDELKKKYEYNYKFNEHIDFINKKLKCEDISFLSDIELCYLFLEIDDEESMSELPNEIITYNIKFINNLLIQKGLKLPL